MPGAALVWDLLAKDQASPAFLKVAGAADKAAASTAKAAAGMSATTARMGKVGKTLTKSVTLPLLGIAAVSVDQAAKYQKSLNVIRVATGQTSTSMAQAQKGLLKISNDTATSTTQLTDSLYTASKAGLPMAKSLAVVRAAAQGAKAEGADLGVVTQGLTSIMASYGSKLSNPVQAMDALVRGSGLAKTTLQDFIGSLANVVPIASSLGVGIDQVSGAIDTMTQHGESAQRATENLANLITNLAGQNNVASQSLQQLGVNTVDLSKNLGKRGLTGSLDVVLKAINKHGKDGLIVTSAFKQAGTATRSLRTELDHMPKTMQANAKAFDSNKMSYKDFNTYAKSLGGQQYQMAKNFIATEATAHGFNNQLKNGNSTTKTLASTLQKSLGGVTGMRTALMLSGTSAAAFASATKQVGAATKDSGKDVAGFADTQKTAAYKADQAKNSFHNMSIELGTALLPAFGKLADAGTKAAHWVDGLSGSQKKLLAFSLGSLAALGPVFSIGAKLSLLGRGIGTATRGIGNALARVGSDATGMSTKATLAVNGLFAAMAGAAVGAAVGRLTQNSSTAVKAIGAIGSAATGAAIGFGVGGPVGALIGGAAGLVSNLASAFSGAGRSASEAGKLAKEGLMAQNDAASTLLGTLQQVGGAYTDQYKQQLVSKLDKKGLLAAASKTGTDPAAVVRAALGSGPDMDKLFAGLTGGKIADKQAQKLLADFIGIQKGAGIAETAFERQQAALGRYAGAIRPFDQSMKGLQAEFAATGLSAKSLAAIQSDSANHGLAAYTRVNAVLRDHATAIGRDAALQLAHGKSSRVVASGVETQVGALHDNLVALGFNEKQVTGLITTYTKLPRSVVTELKKRGVVPADIQAILDKYNLIPSSKNTNVNVTTNGLSQVQSLANALAALHDRTVTVTSLHNGVGIGGRASGGGLPEGVSAVGERGAELAIKHGSKVDILSNTQSKRYLAATGMTAPGFAGGTTPPITHSGKDWVVNGVRYASERAAKNAQGRAGKVDQGTLSSAVSSAIGNVGSAASLKFNINDVGNARIRAQIAAALRVLGQEVHKGLSKHTAGVFRAEIASYVKEANRQLAGLRVKIKGSDLTTLHNALKGTVDDTKTAVDGLLTDLTHAGASARTLASVRAAGSGLMSAQNRLASATDYRSTITSTLAGGFDPTHFGSVGDLIAGYQGQTGQNKTYAQELTSLRNRAGKNSQALALINTLAASGQTNSLEALAQGSSADLNNAAKAYQGYNASLGAGADAATQAKFDGKTVAQLHDDVTKQVQTTDKLINAVGQLARAVGNSHNRGHDHTRREIDSAISELETLVRHGRA